MPSAYHAPQIAAVRNRYDRMEWAGAFGDLGTLIPFVVAYIGILKMDPFGVLAAFGGCMLVCGLYYRTPFPVQPMKAIGAVAAAQAVQTATVTPSAIHVAALTTGLVWLVLGASGLSARLARLVSPTVVCGVIVGLGFGFMLEGVKQMHGDWWIAGLGGLGTLLLMGNRRFPAMLLLLAFGAAVGIWRNPELLSRLASTTVALPSFDLPLRHASANDIFVGAVLLALPQIPLTLGNAVIAITEENNRHFPQAPVTVRKVSVSTGLMNMFSAGVGGVPMCHGAGGMAAHVAFGARTGGSVVILGIVLLTLALLFSQSVQTLFSIFPASLLGVVLFITGAQLAVGAGELGDERGQRLVVVATAALCMWNVAAGFLLGVLLHHLVARGRVCF
jgi:MFS superfamily sulfate permease-like transporter